jgi:hypothetical protein
LGESTLFRFVYLVEMRSFLLIYALFLVATESVEENGVLGDPYVNCGGDHIEIRFDTRNTFRGVVFVKDQIEWPECRSAPVDSSAFSARNASIRLNFRDCNLERHRSVSFQLE